MSIKRVFYLTPNHLTVYRWQNGEIYEDLEIPSHNDSQAIFSDYLARYPQVISALLTDTIEEEYRNETVPHILGRDRHAMLKRKQGQLFRRTPYRTSQLQGRIQSGRRDDKALFTALTNPEALEPWLSETKKHKVPLTGIYSLPMISQRLIKKLRIETPNSLLLTQQNGTLLRQSFFNESHLKISRLSPMTAADAGNYLAFLQEEVQKNQRYLNRLQLLPYGTPLDVYMLTQGELMNQLRHSCDNTPQLHYHFIDIEEVIHRLGIKGTVSADRCEHLFIRLLKHSKPTVNYIRPAEHRYYFMRLARTGILAASSALALGALGWSANNVIEGKVLNARATIATQQSQQLERHYQQALAALPVTPIKPRDMRTAVETANTLSRHKISPELIMAAISQGLSDNPRVRIEEINWHFAHRVGDTEEHSNVNEEADQLFQVATIKATLQSFDDDYHRAFELVERFVSSLRNNPSFVEVKPLAMPLDVNPGTPLSGISGAKDNKPNAQFEIKAVMKVADHAV